MLETLQRLSPKKAFNNEERQTMIDEVSKMDNAARNLTPLLHATLSVSSKVKGLDKSSDGGQQQGSPPAPLTFSAAIHPDIKWGNEELKASGGGVKADMDDMYAYGLVEVVVPTLFEMLRRMAERGNAKPNHGKCKIFLKDPIIYHNYMAAHPQYADMPLACVKRADPATPLPTEWGEGLGFNLSGIPYGDDKYVSSVMEKKTQKIESDIKEITSKLQFVSCQGLYACLSYCKQPLMQHFMQLMPPDVVRPYVERLDSALIEAIHAATGICFEDMHELLGEDEADFNVRRFRGAKRHYGGGVRKQVDVCGAAYVGGLLMTLPRMLDSKDKDGVVSSGFMPELQPWLGAGSFDAGNENTRFAHVVQSGCDWGKNLEELWEGFVEECTVGGVAPEEGILSVPCESAGWCGEKLIIKVQREITKMREDVRFAMLSNDAKKLNWKDERRIAFMDSQPESTKFVASLPVRGETIGNTEFHIMWATYFGEKCALLESHEGKGPGGVIDGYGHKLASAVMEGGGRTKWHDEVKWLIDDWGRQCGVEITTEVYGLFAAVINQSEELNQLPARKRQGMVPDFMMKLTRNIRSLAELKTISQCKTWHTKAAMKERGGAVAKRARALDKESGYKAREADVKFNGVDPQDPGMGPVQARLESFGRVRSFVVGPRGGLSKDLKSFVALLAETGGERMWRRMGARSPVEARGVIKERVTRSLAITGFRGYARLIANRLGIALGDGKKARKRRLRARDEMKDWCDEYRRQFGPCGRAGVGAF